MKRVSAIINDLCHIQSYIDVSIPRKSAWAFIRLNLTSPQQVLFSNTKRKGTRLAQEAAHLTWPNMLRQQRGGSPSQVSNSTHQQGKVLRRARHWDHEPQKESRSLDELPGHRHT